MPNVTISIGGRDFDVACQPGEEAFLQSAAGMLDTEAQVLRSQATRLPESRLLLMAGLMLADRTAGLQDKLAEAEAQLAEARATIDALQSEAPQRVEVPVVPPRVMESLAELAAQAEALADQVEEAAGPEKAKETAD